MKYTLYYNQECDDCAQKAAMASRLDWLKRFTISTAVPATGQLEKGEIVVISNDGKAYTEGYALRAICLNIPLYFPLGLLLLLPPIVKVASKGKAGCNGTSCEIDT